MVFYWSVFALLVIASFGELSGKINRKSIKSSFSIVLFIFFLISSFRWECGTDWDSYYQMFANGGRAEGDSHTEAGYVFFVGMISKISNSYTIFLLAQSFIYYILLYKVVNKINNLNNTGATFYFPILLFVFSQDFAGIFNVRSSVAYMLCLYSVFDIINKRKLPFLIKIILASAFHTTSLIFLICYPLYYHVKVNKKNLFFIAVFCIVIMKFSSYYESFFSLLSMQQYHEAYVTKTAGHSVIGIIKWLFLLVVMLFFVSKKKDEVYSGVIKIYIVGFFMFVWSQYYAPVALRLAGLFLNVVIVWIGLFLSTHSKYKSDFLLMETFYCAISFYALLNSEYKELYVPIRFFWNY